MSDMIADDPFSPLADPDHDRHVVTASAAAADGECGCRWRDAGLSRRQVLAGIGAASLLPATASAGVLNIPCVQSSQRVKPCRHKFCRHYAGEGDYYGR